MTPADGGKKHSSFPRWNHAVEIGQKLVHAYVRGVGALAGGSLVLAGLSRRSLSGLVVAAGGAALVSRTVTGHWLPRTGPLETAANGSAAKDRVIEREDDTARDLVDEAGYDSFPASDPPSSYSPR